MELKNLDRLHQSVRSDVETYCKRLMKELGANLEAISVYGSATGPDFLPGKSNVNLVAVLGTLNQSALTALLETVKWGLKKKIVPPLLLTPSYIEHSLDVFPIEFAEIGDSHVVLAGEDHFASLKIGADHLRLECESQLRAAVLRTRQAYLEVGLTRRGAEAVLHASLTSLIPVFRAMLKLKNEEVPPRKLDVVRRVGEVFGVNSAHLVAILRDKAGDEKIGDREAHEVLAGYTGDLEVLADVADRL